MFASGPPPLTSPLLLLLLRVAAANRRYDHHLLGTSLVWPEPYDARAVIHSRFQVTRDGRVLLTSPRFRPGVPFTLGSFRPTVTRRATVEPDVRPLPADPRLHKVDAAGVSKKRPRAAGSGAAEESAIAPRLPPLVNVVDLCLDAAMDVLWLLDVGTVDTMTDSPRRLAPAKIVRLEIDENDNDDDGGGDSVYNPKTPYRTFEIKTDPRADGASASCLQYLVTYRSRAADGGHYAFVSDAGRGAVLAVNTDTGDQWSVDFPERALAAAVRDVMFMVPLRTADGRTALYVTFASGCRVYAVDLERVDRCSSGAGAGAVAARPSVVEVGRKPYRIAVLGSDAGSRMYFRRPAHNEIWSWDVNRPFHPVGFRLVSAGRDCRAPVHVAPGYGGFVFVLANNFGDYVRNGTGSLGAYTVLRPVSVLPPPPPPTDPLPTGPSATTDATAADEATTECPP